MISSAGAASLQKVITLVKIKKMLLSHSRVMIQFGNYRKTGPEGEFPLLTGEKRNINVTPRSP